MSTVDGGNIIAFKRTQKHETESLESKWASKFYEAFIRRTVELDIKPFDIGEDYYQFTSDGKIVTIKFSVK